MNKELIKKPKTLNNPNIEMSYEEIALELGITVKEVRAAEASALKKLRHPRVGQKLKRYLGI